MDLSRFRPNVGVVLMRTDGKVWLGRRAGTPGPNNWQFPQGGVDKGEALLDAAVRELAEETGARSVSLIGRTDDWIAYVFPPHHARSKAAEGWLGQKQVWFALRFTGEESEFDLGGHAQIEFDAWRWAAIDEALDTVVDFKRETYRQVIEAFRPLTEAMAGAQRPAAAPGALSSPPGGSTAEGRDGRSCSANFHRRPRPATSPSTASRSPSPKGGGEI